MGMTKRFLEDEAAKEHITLNMLIEIGALEPCPVHEDTILDRSGSIDSSIEEIEDAIKANETNIPEGMTGPELREYLQRAYANNCADECYSCHK